MSNKVNVVETLLALLNGSINHNYVDLDSIITRICELDGGNRYDVMIHRFVEGEDTILPPGWYCHIIDHKYSEADARLVSVPTNMKVFGHKTPKDAVIGALKIMFEGDM